ncbi:MAG TPA: type VI secretion system ImpA family N-terminal domain-containing protein [Roseiarcus sp.]
MNDVSPLDPSAAPAPTASPPPVGPPGPVTAETPAELPTSLEAPAAPGPSPEPEPAASTEPPSPLASAARPAPDPFALPLVSEDDPCGPDLDLEGDAEFMNFIAATEGLLPASYYAFNRATIDFSAALQAAERLLKRTLDLRLLALMAKLSILNRDVAGFARRLGNVAWLVREHWEAANPRADGDDYSGRIAQLATLEDNGVVLLPLQYAPLIETNREGALSYRDQLLATGAVQPRSVMLYDLKGQKQTTEPEKFMPAKSIERVLSDVEIARLAGAVETLTNFGASIQSIRVATTEHVGFENAVELPKLAKLAGEMTEFLRAALLKRDPSLAPPPPEAPRSAEDTGPDGAAAAPAAFASRAEVDAALASAFGYFAASEPTSPALLLIRQAREMLGKNLYEVMKLLAPPHADAARVFVGPDGAFTVPVKSLSNAPSTAIQSAPAEPAATRAAAIALIDAVAAHMQKAEPSSPVPYLLDRARNLATRDFASLLQDLLSDEAIAALKKGK